MAMEGPWMQSGANPVNKYQYNGKELHTEFGLNLMDYGARWYDAAVGRWWSVDLMAEAYSSYTTYGYVRNNPLLFIDPNGKWDVSINSDTNQLEFYKQEGDNAKTLAKQLGISEKSAKKMIKKEGKDKTTYSFSSNNVVSAINTFLGDNSNTAKKNCANFCMDVNETSDGVALSDPNPNDSDPNRIRGGKAMYDTEGKLLDEYEGSNEENSQIGDIVTYGFTEETKEKAIDSGMPFHLVGGTVHYSVVLLKTKNGKKVQTVIGKDANTPVVIKPYGQWGKYVPEKNPNTNYNSPIHTKKQ